MNSFLERTFYFFLPLLFLSICHACVGSVRVGDSGWLERDTPNSQFTCIFHPSFFLFPTLLLPITSEWSNAGGRGYWVGWLVARGEQEEEIETDI